MRTAFPIAAMLALAACGSDSNDPVAVNFAEPADLIAANAVEAAPEPTPSPEPSPSASDAATEATSDARQVRCRIANDYGDNFDGQCLFDAEAGGSFALTLPDDQAILGEIMLVSVAITEPGVAEVRGLTRAGINSRWGTATRSKTDRACWIGEDFRICAW